MNRDEEINDYIADVLVRYFRVAITSQFSAPSIRSRSSFDLLSEFWAMSSPVRDLVVYARSHAHELQSVLQAEAEIQRDSIRGRVDASRTQLLRRRSGQPTWMVCITPARTFESGPNRVLAWVLNRARSSLANLDHADWSGSPNYARASVQLGDLEAVRNFEPIRNVLGQATSSHSPSMQAVTESARSRRQIYRLASNAFVYWRDIQAGDPKALRSLFIDSILVPAPLWQRFEMAVGLAAAEKLSKTIAVPFQLGTIAALPRGPFATIGKFSLYWQNRTPLYVQPSPEESERLVSEILEGLGLSEGADRPDFVLVDEKRKRVVSVFESKYFEDTGDDGASSLRDAVQQIVRYVRGYREGTEIRDLIGHSVVALAKSEKFPTGPAKDSAQPWVVDFRSMLLDGLARWARAVSIERDNAALVH